MTTQAITNQEARVTFTEDTICQLQRRRTLATGSWIWDFDQAIIRERFHLRVETETLHRMRTGVPRPAAYRQALKQENPSIRGIP